MSFTTPSLLQRIKRQAALITLAFTDVSKSAVSNQKGQGLESAPQAVTQSVYSADKQTIHDIVRGRQNEATKIMAEKWWRGYIGAKRSIVEVIDGVPTSRELTEEEWRARWEKAADPANKDLGGVVMYHEVQHFHDENKALAYDEKDGLRHSAAAREASRTSNYHVSADPGFYFPMSSITALMIRQDTGENRAVELHTDLQYVKETEVSTVGQDRVLESMREGLREHARERYAHSIRGLSPEELDPAMASPFVLARQQRLADDLAEAEAYELLDEGGLDAETSQKNVSYQMALDPELRYLLAGIRRVALVQEEYSGLVTYAFALQGEPRVSTPHGKIVLTYHAQTAMVTPEEMRALDTRTLVD